MVTEEQRKWRTGKFSLCSSSYSELQQLQLGCWFTSGICAIYSKLEPLITSLITILQPNKERCNESVMWMHHDLGFTPGINVKP